MFGRFRRRIEHSSTIIIKISQWCVRIASEIGLLLSCTALLICIFGVERYIEFGLAVTDLYVIWANSPAIIHRWLERRS